MKLSTAVAISVLLTVPASGGRLKSLLLVEHGHSHTVIVVPDDVSADISETAHDLSEIIGRMSGGCLSIMSEAGDESALILGVQDQDRSLPPLAYHVWRVDSMLYFSGGSDQGVNIQFEPAAPKQSARN